MFAAMSSCSTATAPNASGTSWTTRDCHLRSAEVSLLTKWTYSPWRLHPEHEGPCPTLGV
jgi:hypothetical protein